MHAELATVFYIDAGTTCVRFRGDLTCKCRKSRLEGEFEVDLDALLMQRKPYIK